MFQESVPQDTALYVLFFFSRTKWNKRFTECKIILVHLFHCHRNIDLDTEKKHLPSPLKRPVDDQTAANKVLNTHAMKKRKQKKDM